MSKVENIYCLEVNQAYYIVKSSHLEEFLKDFSGFQKENIRIKKIDLSCGFTELHNEGFEKLGSLLEKINRCTYIPWGKYKNEKYEDIPTSYLNWLNSVEVKDEMVKLGVQMELKRRESLPSSSHSTYSSSSYRSSSYNNDFHYSGSRHNFYDGDECSAFWNSMIPAEDIVDYGDLC